ncbi:hypothetical protein FRB99_006261 [Tulasnella sp. 403]|nr:hypothetical protein FRB99_006261 [Tulasnella sp. 403]
MAPPSRTPQTSVTISSDSEDDSTQLDAFDDDTDLPLPNTGTRGALLEEINIEMTPTGRPEQRRRAPGPSAGGVPASTLGGSTAGTDDPLMKQFASNNATARSWAGAGTGQGMQNIIDSNSPEMEKYKK